jgi:hypothetical protein
MNLDCRCDTGRLLLFISVRCCFDIRILLKTMTWHEGPTVGIWVPHNGYERHEIWGKLMYTCAGGKISSMSFKPVANQAPIPQDRLEAGADYWKKHYRAGADAGGICRFG